MIHALIIIIGLREIQRFTEWRRRAVDWAPDNPWHRTAANLFRFGGATGTILVGLGAWLPVGSLGWGLISLSMATGLFMPCSFRAINNTPALWYLRNAVLLGASIITGAKALDLLHW